MRRPRWVIGLLLGLVGVGPQVVALANAPFVVVQPALTVGLLVLLVLGAMVFHERVGAAEVIGVLAIIGGVALVSWGAPPHSEVHRGGAAVIGVVAGLAVSAVAPFPFRGTRFDFGMGALRPP